MSKKNKRGSIKVKLIVIPLIVVLFGISALGFVSSHFTKQSLLGEMQRNGLNISSEFVETLESNFNALAIIDTLLDNKIRSAGSLVKLSKDKLSNELLKTLATQLDLEQLSYYNSNGEIIYSNIAEYIGWTPPVGHPVHDFMNSSEQEVIEEIRQDSQSAHSLKYGYFKGDAGEFVQIGILADQVQQFTDTISYQGLLDDMAFNEGVQYAMLIDKDLVSIADSNKHEIGTVFNDKGSKAAAIDGIPYAELWYYEADDVTVYDVYYPAIINGEHVGAISIGYSMKAVELAIQKNLSAVIISGAIASLLLGFVLYSSSSDAIKVINKLKTQMGLMGSAL